MNAFWGRLRQFLNVFDNRFEDLHRGTWLSTIYRDLSAGLVVAMTAIPMAMGFAMAMGMEPEQGIIAGAVACLVGRTFGGSKYQVYGPTAAFIPLIAALMAKYGTANGGSPEIAHAFLVTCSIVAGIVLIVMGLSGLGKHARYVPNSIVVGFTIGIAITIALANAGEALGYKSEITGGLANKLRLLWEHRGEFNAYALLLAVVTFALTKGLLRISIFIPAPLIALGVAILLATTVFDGKGIVNLRDEYGNIPTHFFVFTGPGMPGYGAGVWLDLVYFVAAIVFVSGVESLLCSSMADRLADNRGTPFNPDKEFWGQGLVQIITPLINGFPCTGALARTAASIKAGAVTPLAGYFKGILKLTLAYFLAPFLELVPMACIGGILLWVSSNMIKKHEVMAVWRHSRLDAGIMLFTAVMVPLTDFLTGVLSALVLYAILWTLRPLFDRLRSTGDRIAHRESILRR